MGPNERQMLLIIRRVERIGKITVEVLVNLTVAEVQRRTPRDTHFAASSLRVDIGAPFPGFPQQRDGRQHAVPIPADVAKTAISGFRLGDTVVINALAAYFGILAGGRRQDSTGRMIGSLQAPKPYIEPSIKTAIRAATAMTRQIDERARAATGLVNALRASA